MDRTHDGEIVAHARLEVPRNVTGEHHGVGALQAPRQGRAFARFGQNCFRVDPGTHLNHLCVLHLHGGIADREFVQDFAVVAHVEPDLFAVAPLAA